MSPPAQTAGNAAPLLDARRTNTNRVKTFSSGCEFGFKLEDQVAAENRLLELNGFGDIATCTLFPQARAEALEEAYELQAGKFAYRVHAATRVGESFARSPHE